MNTTIRECGNYDEALAAELEGTHMACYYCHDLIPVNEIMETKNEYICKDCADICEGCGEHIDDDGSGKGVPMHWHWRCWLNAQEAKIEAHFGRDRCDTYTAQTGTLYVTVHGAVTIRIANHMECYPPAIDEIRYCVSPDEYTTERAIGLADKYIESLAECAECGCDHVKDDMILTEDGLVCEDCEE